jgi:hypothetical protein
MGVPASEVTHSLLPDVLIMVAVVRIGDALVVDPKLDRPAEFASSPHPPTSAALSGRRLFWARVGWLVIFVLNIGLFSASISAYYDWLINVAGPGFGADLDPATVRTNLEAAGLSIDSYARYQLSISVTSVIVCSVVSVAIFWRRSDDWMALLTSSGLLAFGIFFLTDGPTALGQQYPTVWLPVNLLAFIGSMSFILFLYLFPNGQFVPRWMRWIPILWAVHEVAYYFFPDSVFNISKTLPLLDLFVSLAFFAIAVGAQIYRYRHVSGRVERQQTKWVVFGLVSALLGALAFSLPLNISPTLANFGSPYALAFDTAVAAFLLLIPLSIGIAILRYHLWHIDFIINRTLVYGALTVALALVYFGGVAATQTIFRASTGLEQQSQLAIVISTLVIAGLFNPLRRRIQSFIDRRFYRRKYDTRKTLQAFSAQLRNETDLDALSDDLVGVVRETMQPSHVSLWLRPDSAAKEKGSGEST